MYKCIHYSSIVKRPLSDTQLQIVMIKYTLNLLWSNTSVERQDKGTVFHLFHQFINKEVTQHAQVTEEICGEAVKEA